MQCVRCVAATNSVFDDAVEETRQTRVHTLCRCTTGTDDRTLRATAGLYHQCSVFTTLNERMQAAFHVFREGIVTARVARSVPSNDPAALQGALQWVTVGQRLPIHA